MEVISEGYYIGSDDPSKTTRALDAYQSGIKKVDDRIANHPTLRSIAAFDDDDDDEGLNQARDLAHTKYEDDLTDAENTALDIGYDKIAKTTEEYGYEGFDTIADEFIDALSEFFESNLDPDNMEIYRRTNTIPDYLIVKLGLEDTPPRHLPVIIIATFESFASDGRPMGPEDVYITVYPGDGRRGSKTAAELDGVNVQNFYHSYETYFEAKNYAGDVITPMVEDIGRAIYMDIGIF